MKRSWIILLLPLVAGSRSGAQSSYPGATLARIGSAVQHDTGSRALFAPSPVRSARMHLSDKATLSDTEPAKHHHYVRNGAILGASIGFVAGAIGGGILSDGCDNCSKGRIAVSYVGGVGGAGALVGAILGAVAGRVIGWTHR